MLSRFRFWTAVVLGGALLTGCQTRPARARVTGSTAQGSLPSSAQAGTADRPAEKLAQAHAHYAAAIIHDMNDETDAALQEYFAAACDDPQDEGLVLEVSRRLIQNKQLDKALEVLSRAAEQPDASGEIYARLGICYGQLGKLDQAIAAGRTAIKR